jgi:hypothetical protein
MHFPVVVLRLSTPPVVGKWAGHTQNANLAPVVCFGRTGEVEREQTNQKQITVMEALTHAAT